MRYALPYFFNRSLACSPLLLPVTGSLLVNTCRAVSSHSGCVISFPTHQALILPFAPLQPGSQNRTCQSPASRPYFSVVSFGSGCNTQQQQPVTRMHHTMSCLEEQYPQARTHLLLGICWPVLGARLLCAHQNVREPAACELSPAWGPSK